MLTGNSSFLLMRNFKVAFIFLSIVIEFDDSYMSIY